MHIVYTYIQGIENVHVQIYSKIIILLIQTNYTLI